MLFCFWNFFFSQTSCISWRCSFYWLIILPLSSLQLMSYAFFLFSVMCKVIWYCITCHRMYEFAFSEFKTSNAVPSHTHTLILYHTRTYNFVVPSTDREIVFNVHQHIDKAIAPLIGIQCMAIINLNTEDSLIDYCTDGAVVCLRWGACPCKQRARIKW